MVRLDPENGAKPDFLKKRVAYYVMAADQWRYADTLEEVTRERRMLYLDSNGKANDVFQSGKLVGESPGAASDAYVYDPLDTRPGQLEEEEVKGVSDGPNSDSEFVWRWAGVSERSAGGGNGGERIREAGTLAVDGCSRHRFQCRAL